MLCPFFRQTAKFPFFRHRKGYLGYAQKNSVMSFRNPATQGIWLDPYQTRLQQKITLYTQPFANYPLDTKNRQIFE